MVFLRSQYKVLHDTCDVTMDHSDDGSVSSTLTVERLNDAKGLHTEYGQDCINVNETEIVAKKNVTFNLENNAVYETSFIHSKEYKQRWYSKNNYKEFRMAAVEGAKQIRQIESLNQAPFAYQRILENAFAACCDANNRCYESDLVLPETDLVHLVRWVEVATSRCGLEKWSIEQLRSDRSTRRKQLTKIVLEIQDGLCSESESSLSDGLFLDQCDEDIRSSCVQISRPSCLFARVMAEALERAEAITNKVSS